MNTTQQTYHYRPAQAAPYKPSLPAPAPSHRWSSDRKPGGMSRDELRAIVAEQLG